MLCIAIEKAQQSPTQLTSIHADLAQVSIYCTAYYFSYDKSMHNCILLEVKGL